MKKSIITLMCLTAVCGLLPINAGAVSEPIYINDNPESWTKTVYSGDVNEDGKVSIADAVALQNALLQKTYSDSSNLDVNYDGHFDSFDLVIMRNLVLNPENALSRTYSVDVLKSCVNSENGTLITDFGQLNDYLSASLTDSDEINKYLERYSEEFFAENNLFIEPFTQARGNGVFTTIKADGVFDTRNFGEYSENYCGIVGVLVSEYEHDRQLYPLTNTTLLAQIAVPKSATDSGMQTAVLSDNWFGTDDCPCSYTSPDGETQFIITQSAFLFSSDLSLYLKNSDGSLSYVTDFFTDDGCMPFSEEGEWFTDSEGNSVFGDRENYTITWTDGGFTIDQTMNTGGLWEKTSITNDGEVTENSSYEYSYDKWKEEEYEAGDYSHVYKSPDGSNAIRITQYIDKNVYGKYMALNFYVKCPDGSIKQADKSYSRFIIGQEDFLPFDQNLTDWTKDDDGNDVISNISDLTGSPTFSLTWKENSVDVSYLNQTYNQWETVTIDFE